MGADAMSGGLFGLGTSLLGGIGGLLKGESDGTKKLKETFGLLKNKLGGDVFHPEQYLADYYRSNQERWGRDDERSAKRVGMDSFLFANASKNRRDKDALNFFGGFKAKNDAAKSQNDLQILQSMAGIGGALG